MLQNFALPVFEAAETTPLISLCQVFRQIFARGESGINYLLLRKKSPELTGSVWLSPIISSMECQLHCYRQLWPNASVAGGSNMTRTCTPDWKEISRAASREQDPEKLLQLVHELNQILEHEEKSYLDEARKNF